jgi:hypothetical protein
MALSGTILLEFTLYERTNKIRSVSTFSVLLPRRNCPALTRPLINAVALCRYSAGIEQMRE